MRVSRYRPAVLFDALFDNAVWDGEHLVNEVGEAVEFGVATLRILGRRSRVARQNSLLESESRRRVPAKSTQSVFLCRTRRQDDIDFSISRETSDRHVYGLF